MLRKNKTIVEVYKTTHKRLAKARLTKREEFDEVINRALDLLEARIKKYSKNVDKLHKEVSNGDSFYNRKKSN